MKFKLNDTTEIDTDAEPWKRTGVRVGIYGDPGSGKSYTTGAVFVEQFLDQNGTVIIFEPRAEWQTLKSKFPDIQVVGGPHLQNIPFTASHPKLYADAVVESGVSLIFYTADAPTIDKLIDFVSEFLKYLMKGLERTKRPVMVVLEEANRYVPLSPRNHPEGAAPWVLGRMIGRILEMERDARKLGIVPVKLSQRPQDVNFSARQLDNVTLLGMFSPQDLGYIEKEVIKPMNKNLNLTLDAKDLAALKVSQWFLVTRGKAEVVSVTVKRRTPHGGDTPELGYVPTPSNVTASVAARLTEQLQAEIAKEAAEESELEKTKRKLKDSENRAEELSKKVEFAGNLREMLSGNGQADPKLIEKVTALEQEKETLQSQVRDMNDGWAKDKSELEGLRSEMEGYSKIEDWFGGLIQQNFNLHLKPQIIELIRQHAPRQPERVVTREIAPPTAGVTKPPRMYQEWLERLKPTERKILQYAMDNIGRSIPLSEMALRLGMRTDSLRKNYLSTLRKIPGWKDDGRSVNLEPP